MGPSFRAARRFWLAHFKFVLDCSLEGAVLLDEIYRREGKLSPELLPPRRGA